MAWGLVKDQSAWRSIGMLYGCTCRGANKGIKIITHSQHSHWRRFINLERGLQYPLLSYFVGLDLHHMVRRINSFNSMESFKGTGNRRLWSLGNGPTDSLVGPLGRKVLESMTLRTYCCCSCCAVMAMGISPPIFIQKYRLRMIWRALEELETGTTSKNIYCWWFKQ